VQEKTHEKQKKMKKLKEKTNSKICARHTAI